MLRSQKHPGVVHSFFLPLQFLREEDHTTFTFQVILLNIYECCIFNYCDYLSLMHGLTWQQTSAFYITT